MALWPVAKKAVLHYSHEFEVDIFIVPVEYNYYYYYGANKSFGCGDL